MSSLTWQAPGPGHWALDRSHVNRPATLISQHVQEYGTARGTRRMFRELGAPLDALDFRFATIMSDRQPTLTRCRVSIINVTMAANTRASTKANVDNT